MKHFYTCVYVNPDGISWPGQMVDGSPSEADLPHMSHLHHDEVNDRFVVSVQVTRVRINGSVVRAGKKGRKRDTGRVTAGGMPLMGDAVRCCSSGAVGFIVHDCPDCPEGSYDIVVGAGTFDGLGGELDGLRSGASINYANAEIVTVDLVVPDCWTERTPAQISADYPGGL